MDPSTGPATKPNTSTTHQQTNPPDPAPVPAELLETVARALAAALIPLPRQPGPPPGADQPPDFLTAAQLAQRLGVSRETVRRLAIAGALPHTVMCRGARKTTRRFPRRFADDFAASGLDADGLAAFAAQWRARVTAPPR
jgi:excisionase family DNA binding protein